jgi:hypothetical protein
MPGTADARVLPARPDLVSVSYRLDGSLRVIA